MADAITAALLKEADAFGVRAPEFRIPPSVQAQRDAEAAAIRARELQPNGGGAIPTSTVVQGSQAGASDPITASLMAEAGTSSTPVPSTSRVDQIPGMTPQPSAPEQTPSLFDKAVSAVKPYVENAYGFVGDLAKNAIGKDLAAKEAALSVGTGLVAPLVGNLAGAAKTVTSGKLGTQEGIQAGEKRAAEITNALTYQPRAPEAREAVSTASRALEASKLQGVGPPELTALADIAAGSRAASTVRGTLKDAGLTSRGELPASTQERGQFASVGASASAATEQARAMVANASPEIRQAVERAIKQRRVNMDALNRIVEADSLPVKVNLTEGQATQYVSLLSDEQNARGKNLAYAQRFNEQNKQLVENADAIRESAAPDVFVRSKPEKGEILIKAYESKDSALNADINAKYTALKDANGGQFPIDAKAFVDAADKALHKQLLYDSVPGTGGGMHGGNAGLRATLDRLRDNGMTFENFESLRTNLARIQRSSSADGNVKAAAGVIRDALEALPMPAGAEHLKPLADAARSAAKARFDLIKRDPAYKAVVEGKASADKFIDRYIIGGDLKGVRTMKQNLAHDPVAGQTMAAGTIDHLTDAARVVGGEGNFSQAGYNKALANVRPKVRAILDPEHARQLDTLGNVARYTQAQPRGSYVNNSNTLVSALAEKAANVAETGTNIIFGGKYGIPVGSMVREQVKKAKLTRAANKSLAPGAGISLNDIKEAGR